MARYTITQPLEVENLDAENLDIENGESLWLLQRI